jgi:hypothetical protein
MTSSITNTSRLFGNHRLFRPLPRNRIAFLPNFFFSNSLKSSPLQKASAPNYQSQSLSISWSNIPSARSSAAANPCVPELPEVTCSPLSERTTSCYANEAALLYQPMYRSADRSVLSSGVLAHKLPLSARDSPRLRPPGCTILVSPSCSRAPFRNGPNDRFSCSTLFLGIS